MPSPRHLIPLAVALAVVGPLVAGAGGLVAPADSPDSADWGRRAEEAPASIKVELKGVDTVVHLVETADGGVRFVLRGHDGTYRPLTPDEFARRVVEEQRKRHFWLRLLNITSPWGMAWVGLGLLGQLLFTGRMLYQWLASERTGRSVVPPAFWWMSLAGASMLLVYFVWRKDVVGVLGQATGWGIYLRNLWLIYRPSGSPS